MAARATGLKGNDRLRVRQYPEKVGSGVGHFAGCGPVIERNSGQEFEACRTVEAVLRSNGCYLR